ncbi:hypothetical protein JL721_6851 [Aureococcus anophagefferens]|nr:hypothetical protein JL721_6851 [Aureococcus anophagefferens]
MRGATRWLVVLGACAHHADVVLWLPQWAAKAPLGLARADEKLVILDEHDDRERRFGPYAAQRGDAYLAYFKRSFANKSDGAFLGFSEPLFPRYYAMQYVFPTNRPTCSAYRYSVSSAYLLDEHAQEPPRELDVVCTLRVGAGRYPARARVLLWARELARERRLSGFFGEFDTSQRNVISAPYFALMRRARVVVTCNPGDWEGDFRTWEAVASGALVFMDRHYAPMPHAFVDGDDAYIYDNGDGPAFKARLGGALAPANASRTAEAGERGLRKALRHHRAVSRVDWLLRSALAQHPKSGPFRAPGFDEPELGHALLARALADPPPRARPRPADEGADRRAAFGALPPPGRPRLRGQARDDGGPRLLEDGRL